MTALHTCRLHSLEVEYNQKFHVFLVRHVTSPRMHVLHGEPAKMPYMLWQQSTAYMQEYQEQAREARRAAREDARQAAEEGNAVEPLSAVAQRRLKLDMPHELAGHVRPGAMSRLPHTLQDYHATVGDIQVLCKSHRAVATHCMVLGTECLKGVVCCFRLSRWLFGFWLAMLEQHSVRFSTALILGMATRRRSCLGAFRRPRNLDTRTLVQNGSGSCTGCGD